MSNKLSNNVFKKKTGIQNIQEYLESGRSITALEALSNFGIFRLASAIEVLRKRGMNIETDTKQDPNGKTYARYSLVASVNEVQPEVVAEEAPKVEFKEGDRVVIKAGVDDTYYKAGDVGTITAVGDFDLYVTFESGHALTVHHNIKAWYVFFEDVDLVPAKKELKVGARVRSLHPLENGLLGTVLDVEYPLWPTYPIKVQQDGGAVGIYAVSELEVI